MFKDDDDSFITPEELKTRYRNKISLATLANWRASGRGQGPNHTKIGGRVLYRISEVLKWEAIRTFKIKRALYIADMAAASVMLELILNLTG